MERSVHASICSHLFILIHVSSNKMYFSETLTLNKWKCFMLEVSGIVKDLKFRVRADFENKSCLLKIGYFFGVTAS